MRGRGGQSVPFGFASRHGGAANPVSFVWDGDDLLNEYRLGGVSCRYDVLDGEVFGERRDGSRYLYVPDPLGSINHLLDTNQTIAGTYTFWPYGEVQSHTGPDTPLQFVGGLGYYTGGGEPSVRSGKVVPPRSGKVADKGSHWRTIHRREGTILLGAARMRCEIVAGYLSHPARL